MSGSVKGRVGTRPRTLGEGKGGRGGEGREGREGRGGEGGEGISEE